MATNRFNYNDKFSLKGQKVGISSNTPEESLDIASGILKGVDLQSNSGITTFSTYEGFLNSKTSYTGNVTIDTGESGTLSGEVVIGAGLTMSVGTGATSGQGSVASVKVSNTFTPPIGFTTSRPTAPQPGALFYNKDFRTIEYWDGNFWRQVDNTTTSSRGITAGSYPSETKQMEFINIATKGNSRSFGDMTEEQGLFDAASSSTRMVTSGGYNSSFGGGAVMDIQYVTMASAGNTIDFGDQTQGTYGTGASSSSTRALIMGGNRMPTSSPYDDGNDGNNTICYIEIATIGNALDFGDLSARRAYPSACGDSLRMVIFGGYSNEVGSPLGLKTSDTVLYASKGNAVDFGEAAHGGSNKAASNSKRGIWAGTSGGSNTYTNIMYTVSIQSLGNALDFGDRTYDYVGSAMSSETRMVMAGGKNAASPHATTNIMDFVEFASLGNAQDFGDISFNQADAAGTSDSHGGLGGF